MDITLNVTFGDDATLTDAQHMLGTVCNELLRTNLALTMQGEASG